MWTTSYSGVDSLPLLVPLYVVTNHIYIHTTPSSNIQPPASISAYEDTDPPWHYSRVNNMSDQEQEPELPGEPEEQEDVEANEEANDGK